MSPTLLPTSLPDPLSWLLQTTVLLTAGWLFYRTVLRPERFFHFNRRFLLLTPWLALLLPVLLGFAGPLLRSWLPAEASSGRWLTSSWLPAVTVQAGATPASALLSAGQWLLGLYAAGAGLLLGRLGWQLWRLWHTTHHWPREPAAGYTLVYTGGRRPVSSFGHWVFWDETAGLSAAESQAVLAHEAAHVRQGHTYERLALEAARALLWPSPLAHCYPRALELTHEFLADAAALQTTAPLVAASSESYATLLARLALRQLHPSLPLSHSFTHSLTLTRIRMLASTTPRRRWKQWLLLPLSALLLLALGCEQELQDMPPPPPPPTMAAPEALAPPPPPTTRLLLRRTDARIRGRSGATAGRHW
ncbi:hypothetical protein LRS06_08810 [Hymenobacter sp. J193]|uniref:hypothetical protein n=1 Tax=Hymenobacter sp. J193 TaxID=2898429 RepID=UPI002150F08A|nr:hypothetical protein [Hymenobacter sp. J193]MCR5887877.1 hypothetical protein [Hymenobacter sp. J193]